MPCKFFFDGESLLRVKVERADVEVVQRFVSETDERCTTDTVRSRIEHEVRRHPTSDEIEVELEGVVGDAPAVRLVGGIAGGTR